MWRTLNILENGEANHGICIQMWLLSYTINTIVVNIVYRKIGTLFIIFSQHDTIKSVKKLSVITGDPKMTMSAEIPYL